MWCNNRGSGWHYRSTFSGGIHWLIVGLILYSFGLGGYPNNVVSLRRGKRVRISGYNKCILGGKIDASLVVNVD